MANKNLTGQTIAESYDQLLLSADEGGVTGQTTSATQIICGTGTAGAGNSGTTPLYLSRDSVGIGTATPSGTLDVAGAPGKITLVKTDEDVIDNDDLLGFLYFAGSEDSGVTVLTGASIQARAANNTGGWQSGRLGTDLEFWTAPIDGTVLQRMTILDSGNVGIGTASPDQTLEIDGGSAEPNPLLLYRNSADNVSIQFKNSEGDPWYIGKAENGAFAINDGAEDLDSAGCRFLIDSSGKVGIGTSAPGTNFVGSYNYTATGLLMVDGNSSQRIAVRGATSAALDLVDTGAATDEKWMQLINQDGLTMFRSFGDDGSVEIDDILVIDNTNGNVGIGTSAPGEALDVVGNVEISGNIQLGNAKEGVIKNDGDSYTLADGASQNIECCNGGMGLVLVSDSTDNEGCLYMVNRNPATVTILHQSGSTFASSGTTNDTVTLIKAGTGDDLAALTNYKSSRNFRVLVLAT